MYWIFCIFIELKKQVQDLSNENLNDIQLISHKNNKKWYVGQGN